MRTTFALFFVGLIAMSSVAAMNSDVKYMQSIQGTEFGRTLIESIQIELKSSTGADAVDRILNLLRQINAQIVEAGRVDVKQHTAYVATTKAQIKHLAAKVVQLTAEIKTDNALIVANDALIAADQKLIKGFNKQVAANQASLKQNLETQKETTRVYNEEFAKLSGYIAGIAGARSVIQKMLDTKNTVSFVEVASKLNQVEFSHPKFAGFMNVLSEMLSSTERVHGASHVNAVMRLLDQLHDQLVKEITRLTFVYKRRIGDLKIQENRFRTTIALLQSNIAKAEQRIAQNQMENTMARQRIVTNTQRKEEAIQEGKDLTQDLADHIKAFNQRVASRKEEMAIIAKVINIFETRITDEVRSGVANLTN